MQIRFPIRRRTGSTATGTGRSHRRFGCSFLFSPLVTFIVLVLSLTCATLPASAQYFGRNKVRYKPLDFQVLKTEHFDIYFYPSAREGVDLAARMAERWLARLERALGHELHGRQPLILYASHPDFEQTNTIQGDLGEGTGGVTEPLRRRIVLPMAGPLADTDHVIGHELVHAFQFDMTTRAGAGPGETGANSLPLWFIEGMAEYLSLGPVDPHTSMWLRDAARGEKLPTIKDLNNPTYFPYRWGQAFWAYVGGRYGDSVIPDMLLTAAAAGNPDAAFQRVLGTSEPELSSAWHASIRAAYSDVLQSTTSPEEIGTVIVGARGAGGTLNVGPAMSPDGRWLAFLSERTLLSIELYVAEAATGRVERRLTSTATSPHFSSLQFIYSAGAWDAESRHIALATVSEGRPALTIFDALKGGKVREITLTTVDEIFNPTWSPDGKSVAFTGLSRGLTDLYVLDLQSERVRALTHDAYSDLQPAWSPDGTRIAFVTDRFSSRLDALDIGPYRLALVDPMSGRIEQVRAFTSGKNINPQWAPDSSAIYYVSDRDGISNLYRVTLDGDVTQLTTLQTGVSGITAESPGMSIAARTGLAAVTVYNRGRYEIHTLEVATKGRPPGGVPAGAGALPPLDRVTSDVAALLADPQYGLPPDQGFVVNRYRPTLSLDAIGQPSIAFGADRYGAAIGGGLSFYFSDLLGNHHLAGAFNVSQGLGGGYALSNTTAQAAYLNSTRRWNWGVIGGQVPYISGGFQSGYGTVNGESAWVEQTILFRQTERSASGIAAYPFSRARRVEIQGGLSQITFDETIETQAYSLDTGHLIYEETNTIPVGDSLTLGTTSAALVFDASRMGATSPVAGSRYRLEIAPMFGSLEYVGLLADYRRYLMPVSFYTIALRGLHYGRYGPGGEDPRLNPLYVGYPSLVRGYDVTTFGAADCVPTSTSSCPLYDRLIGSRVLVGNAELRFPLFRPLGASRRMYGPLPVELGLFADGGVAWNRGQRPALFGGEREGVSSVGVTIRVNFLGLIVGQFDIARPLQRPREGWTFEFMFMPGF